MNTYMDICMYINKSCMYISNEGFRGYPVPARTIVKWAYRAPFLADRTWGRVRVQGLGCRVEGLGFRVYGSGCRIKSVGFAGSLRGWHLGVWC